jgi:hypothetical protein|nr:MAG TPA: hypothetical protein [Caudoviricetes sp.]
MKEIRRISGAKVRQACIEHDWFTCGDIDAYNALFEFVGDINREGKNVSKARLECIAEMIKDNSETDYNIPEIMFVLNAECCTTYFE